MGHCDPGLTMPAVLDGQPVAAVLFDYGLTLATFDRPERSLQTAYTRIGALLSSRLGIPAPEGPHLLTAVHDRVEARVAGHDRDGQLREIDITAVHHAAYAELGLHPDDALLDQLLRIEQEAWWPGVHLAPASVPTLRTLRAAGVRTALCSNAPYRPASMVDQLAHLGLAPHLDAAVFSAAVGWRKPSPHLFHAALAALQVAPTDAVMVGDRCRDDIAGARAAGLARTVRLREHHDDAPCEDDADHILDRLADLPALLGLRTAPNPPLF